jgi:hypothetical protein
MLRMVTEPEITIPVRWLAWQGHALSMTRFFTQANLHALDQGRSACCGLVLFAA